MNTNTNPRNASEALAQANRFERAKQIIAEGYTFENMGEGYGIAVCKPGKLAAAYWIYGPFCEEGCSCPDAAKGNKCKHEIAWSILQDEAAKTKSLFDEDMVAMMEAQCAEYDALQASME